MKVVNAVHSLGIEEASLGRGAFWEPGPYFLSSCIVVFGVGTLAFPCVQTANIAGNTEDRKSSQRT